MGEAKRRRAAAERPGPVEPARSPSGLTFAEIEEIASEDPGDRTDREAHGFTREDRWDNSSVVCRNGCGLPYSEVVAGKIRKCHGSEASGQ